MPLLRFLAFYQAIEYYFPTCAQEESKRRARTVLENPTFSPDRDADIGRLLAAAQGSRGGYRDERSQMRATARECVDPVELREFIAGHMGLSDALGSKEVGLPVPPLPLDDEEADLRDTVSDRMYDIRGKVVHTKSGGAPGQVELLLPFSREAALPGPDIELATYIVQRVLISASEEM